MDIEDDIYDVVVIGAGMGGLACANILCQEGMRVALLEKNRQLGGNLQIFSRDKCVFDTGVHYIGGLDPGQNLHQLFRYFGIMEKLKLKRLDAGGFDRVHFGTEEMFYPYGIGYENFVQQLSQHFPDETQAIQSYCDAVRTVAKRLPLAQLKAGDDDAIVEIDFTLNARKFINGLTTNEKLQKVLAGTNMLYAGSERTPFYVHALVLNSYIESSWRCVDGSAQIVKSMAGRIRASGGTIKGRCEMVSANYDDTGSVTSINLANGKVVKGKYFISNLHPKRTIEIFGPDNFKKSYVNRIMGLKDTGSVFILHLVFHENSFEYLNYNIFQINQEDVWDLADYEQKNWPSYFMISNHANSKTDKYSNGASVICGMVMEELAAWKDTYNNIMEPRSRGEDYEAFKKVMAEKVIDALELLFPDIRKKIKSYYCTTPLSFRDYTATPEGSAYGIEKDSNAAFKTIVNTKTNIPNLFLTGQNLNLHGILGVSLSAVLTCFNLVDKKELLRKINEA
jgi:all-trans-retinol 13,14-reductase